MTFPGKSYVHSLEKSPSPQPFKEPEGLITIDLNDDAFTNIKDDVKIFPKAPKKNNAKILALMFYVMLIIIVLVCLSFIVNIFTNKVLEVPQSPIKLLKEEANFERVINFTNNISFKDKIKCSIFFNESNIVSTCQISRIIKNCYEIFYNSELINLAELCTINDMLDVLLKMEIRASTRTKRDIINEAYPLPVTETYQSDVSSYLNSISTPNYMLSHIYSVSNVFPNQYIDEYEVVDYPNSLYLETYQYEDNAAPEFNNNYQNQYNFDYTLKKSIEENSIKNHRNVITVEKQRDTDMINNYKLHHVYPVNYTFKQNSNGSSPKSTVSEVSTSAYFQFKTDSSIEMLGTAKNSEKSSTNVPSTTTVEPIKVNKGIKYNSSLIFTINQLMDVTTNKNNFINYFPRKNDGMYKNVSNKNNSTQEQETSTDIMLFTTPYLESRANSSLETNNDLIIYTSSSSENDNVSKLSASLDLNNNIKTGSFPQEKHIDKISLSPRKEETKIRTNAKTDFRQKSKTDAFLIANDDTQANQQTFPNPCFYPYITPYLPPFLPSYVPPYRVATSFDGSHLLKVVPMSSPKIQQYILNPPMYPFMQSTLMQPPSYASNYLPQMEYQLQHQEQHNQIQVSGPGGQYYMCNSIPAPTNNVVPFPGIEVRRENFQLQDLIPRMSKDFEKGNNTREAHITCPKGQESCADGSRCIINRHICDNEVNCNDESDERFCSCRDRVGKIRTCDGYFDCPNGEDEQGCFGCEKDEFSCDDWSRFRRSTCIPLKQRCDNIRQCEVTGKDEEDCSVLTDHLTNQPQFIISNSVGFLLRNYKGRWYPTCFGIETWAMDVCKIEAGPSVINPKTYLMSTTEKYDGQFINILPNNDVSLVNTCLEDRVAFVQCPPIYCGLRMTVKNPYRQFEVETSAEDLLTELEHLSREAEIIKETANYSSYFSDNANLDINSRVVGGKPSQPAAWPWLISIYKNGIFHCGGVLINELWVVTAAHCVDRFWQYYFEIEAGMLRRFSYSPMEQHRWAALIIPHEDYDRGSLRNDIALIKMSSPARYNRYIRPICLPTEATAGFDFLQGPPAGAICTTVGWGATVEHGSDPDHMREVEVPVLEHCKHPEDLDGDVICAGLSEGGKDACQGDSGGPFMCRNPNNPSQWYLAGIVSHGDGCARPNEPGVYTRVSKYVGWITENIKQEETFLNRLPLQRCPGFVCKGVNKCLPKKRRCDKIVDCFLGDDEMNCENNFHDIFNYIRRQYSGVPKNAKQAENNINLSYMLDIMTNRSLTESPILSNPLSLKDYIKNSTSKINRTNTLSSNINLTTSEEQHYFKCKSMLQIVPISRKCNKIVDCEDGTDEHNCLCADYVRNYDPNAICDGITDCSDISDEIDCVMCESFEYYCRQSQKCIDMSKRCDGIPDCPRKEDEWDCAALTNGVTLTLDSDLRPKLSMSGIITINRFGVWRPLCANMSDNEASIATNVCNLLGFEEYIGYHKYQVKDKPLNVTIDGFKQTDYINGPSDMCSGLYVRCSNVSLDSLVHNVYQDNVTSDVELYTSPWNALIYSDGIYRCMGTILNTRWIVTSENCFEGITILQKNYVVALLGKGKALIEIEGPHEQIIRITESIQIEKSDLILLRLEENITFSRYVKPANLHLIRRDGYRLEKCIAIGLERNSTKYIVLVPSQHCLLGYRCFKTKSFKDCQNSIPWTGTIVCDFGSGWYPAAVYHDRTGHCGFSHEKQYTSINSYENSIANAMEQPPFEMEPSYCDGFRCKLGECITKHKVCNGVPDCRSSEDEEPNLCYEKEMVCHLTDTCVCPVSHLKCRNNKCILKSSFCDRINDCGDYEDEPDTCSCKEYLRITDPSKICDGIVNCMDRTDEDPKLCPCKLHDIRCGNTSYCISNEVICDGFQDCPNGEDEMECMALKAEDGKRSNVGEVMTRTGGIWHPGCFKMNYTSTELEEMCYNLGFTGRSGNQLIASRNVTSLTTSRHVIDKFSIIWIRRNAGNKLKLKIRTGNEPYVKLLSDDQCYRLFLACM